MESLIKTLRGETTQKEFSLGANLKVKLRTLTQEEMDNVVARTQAQSIVTQGELMKKPVLGYSLMSINNVPMEAFPEVKEAIKKDREKPTNYIVEEVLGKLDAQMCQELYELYLELADEVRKERENLKKSSASQQAEPVGSSSDKSGTSTS